MDINMESGDPLSSHPAGADKTVPGFNKRPVPVIRLYGVTDDGHSVLCHVHGFTPYFYARAPKGLRQEHLSIFRRKLDEMVGQRKRGGEYMSQHIVAVQLESGKRSIYGYTIDQSPTPMVKIWTAMPTLVPTARGVLENGFSYMDGVPSERYKCFEANVPFVLRYLIDQDIPGCSWLELPANTYTLRPREKCSSACQIEVDAVFDCVVRHHPEGPWQRIAPYRILSFDIECAGRKGHFPDPEHDPVIQIANVISLQVGQVSVGVATLCCHDAVRLQGSSTPVARNVFVLGSCTPIVGAQVFSFEHEKDLLIFWARFVRESDPDVLTGYNIQNFDIPYILNRAKRLGVMDEVWKLGRIIGG